MRTATAALLIAAAANTDLGAQALGVSLSAAGVSANHELLGRPLTGVRLELRAPFQDQGATFFGSVSVARGSANRMGIPCGGLINPSDTTCVMQPMRDESKLGELSLGALMRVARLGRVDLAITGDLRLASVHTKSRAVASGKELGAANLLQGLFVGALASWRPSARPQVTVDAALVAGRYLTLFSPSIEDGYTPFQGGFGASQLHLGLSWRP